MNNRWFEDKLNGFGIDGVNGQSFLDFGAALLDLDQHVAKRDGRTVPETLRSVEFHVAQHVLRILSQANFNLA